MQKTTRAAARIALAPGYDGFIGGLQIIEFGCTCKKKKKNKDKQAKPTYPIVHIVHK